MIKALAAVLAGKDAQKIYNKEKLGKRPVLLSRKFVGAVLVALGAVLSWKFGVDGAPITAMAQGVDDVWGRFNDLYDLLMNNKSVVLAAWGGLLQILGYAKEIGKLIKGSKGAQGA